MHATHTCRVLTMIEEEPPRPIFCGTGCLTVDLFRTWPAGIVVATAVAGKDGAFDMALCSERDDEAIFVM